MPRFVVLRHEMPAGSPRLSHWDFMLEDGQALCTWALDEHPRAGAKVRATSLADHRLDYLDLEGPISGNRGSVTRLDRGEYECLERNESHWRVKLAGATLRSELTIVRDPSDESSWTFQFDEPR
jgi:hypothetical protein